MTFSLRLSGECPTHLRARQEILTCGTLQQILIFFPMLFFLPLPHSVIALMDTFIAMQQKQLQSEIKLMIVTSDCNLVDL